MFSLIQSNKEINLALIPTVTPQVMTYFEGTAKDIKLH